MARQIPFAVSIKETVGNGATQTFEYKAPNGQDFVIRQILWLVGATFSLIRIQDDNGIFYTNASSNDPIPSSELPTSNTDVRQLDFPAIPLVLKGGTTITFEVLDTGGGSASTLFLSGELTIP